MTASYGAVLLPEETADPSEALRAADRRMYANKSSSRTSAGRQTTDALLSVLAERHPDLKDHVDDVSRLCADVAETLGVPEEERGALLRAASLHDIGKAAIPDAILSKPGPLDDDEWRFIRQHTVIGERIMAVAPALSAVSQLVRSSHERVDGSGYPDGLRGDEIPLGSRIIAVCDAFDAMTSSRSYRLTPLTFEEALAELRHNAGHQFDPHVVEAFTRTVTARPAVAQLGDHVPRPFVVTRR